MNKLLVAAAIVALTATIAAHAESKAIYVGDQRYSCTGNSPACAQVEANNRQRESQRAGDYQRDQDHAQAVVDRERRKDDDRRNDQRRYP